MTPNIGLLWINSYVIKHLSRLTIFYLVEAIVGSDDGNLIIDEGLGQASCHKDASSQEDFKSRQEVENNKKEVFEATDEQESGLVQAGGPQGGLRPHSTPATLCWLEKNYELSEGVCIPRNVVYFNYVDFCSKNQMQPVNAASFGKVCNTDLLGPLFVTEVLKNNSTI